MSDPILSPVMDYVHAAASAQDDLPTRLATVTQVNTNGTIRVRFDGETAAAAKDYVRLTSSNAYTGDRVVMLRVGSTWVCVGTTSIANYNVGPLRLLGRQEFTNHGPLAFPFSNSGAWQQAFLPAAQTFPAETRIIHTSIEVRGVSGSNAACFWRYGVLYDVGSAEYHTSGLRSHNNAVAAISLGFAATGWSMRPSAATTVRPFVDVNVDSAGGAVYCSPFNAVFHYFV